jgi:hypothetical protein
MTRKKRANSRCSPWLSIPSIAHLGVACTIVNHTSRPLHSSQASSPARDERKKKKMTKTDKNDKKNYFLGNIVYTRHVDF